VIPSLTILSFVITSFLYCDTYHRDPHSFPTRRSSDLYHVDFVIKMVDDDVPIRLKLTLDPKAALQVGESKWETVLIRFNRIGTRSEEHTSELQSRSDLVCRLLLEKKKVTRSRRMPVAT